MSENTFPVLVRRLLCGWLLAACLEYLFLGGEYRLLAGLEGLRKMSFLRLLLVSIITALVLWWVNKPKTERFVPVLCWLIYTALAVAANDSVPLLLAQLTVLIILLAYAFWGWRENLPPIRPNRETNQICSGITAGISIAFFLFVSLWTLCRVWNYNAPSYDLGIFSQMFYSMKEMGLPITTLERDGALSHFAVHVSPIYYLMLPVYSLWPCPENLQLQQAAIMASAGIPLWKLARHHGLTPIQRTLLCGVLLFYPAYAGGAGYDLHENCFLTPCILWLFYGIDRKWGLATALSALLVMLVKEDAPVYTAVIGLWLLVRGLLRKRPWDKWAGAALFAISLTWFLCATAWLANFGDGVMTGRYQNFIYDGSGSLLTVVKTAVLCPAKVLFECVDPEKLGFLGLTLLPLLGLPLLTRCYENYILLIPYMLLNLMSDYRYQHDIFFQYTFGSAACLVYLVLRHLPNRRRTGILVCALLLCGGCFCWKTLPKAMTYPARCLENLEQNRSVRLALEQIPSDAAVAASTFYTVPLSSREILYDLDHSSTEHILSCEYVVLSQSDESWSDLLLNHGFQPLTQLENILTIYQKSSG